MYEMYGLVSHTFRTNDSSLISHVKLNHTALITNDFITEHRCSKQRLNSHTVRGKRYACRKFDHTEKFHSHPPDKLFICKFAHAQNKISGKLSTDFIFAAVRENLHLHRHTTRFYCCTGTGQ